MGEFYQQASVASRQSSVFRDDCSRDVTWYVPPLTIARLREIMTRPAVRKEWVGIFALRQLHCQHERFQPQGGERLRAR
jgi:hypothetical protein